MSNFNWPNLGFLYSHYYRTPTLPCRTFLQDGTSIVHFRPPFDDDHLEVELQIIESFKNGLLHSTIDAPSSYECFLSNSIRHNFVQTIFVWVYINSSLTQNIDITFQNWFTPVRFHRYTTTTPTNKTHGLARVIDSSILQ